MSKFIRKEMLESRLMGNVDIKPINGLSVDEISNHIDETIEWLNKHLNGFKQPIYINSGYRNPELNNKVGGVKTSHHLLGYAVDLSVEKPLLNLLEDLLTSYLDEIDQLIIYPTFIHISLHPKNRRQKFNK